MTIKVKPLVWEKDWSGEQDDIPVWRGRNPLNLHFCVSFAGTGLKRHEDADPKELAERLAHAQTDYEARILSAIEAVDPATIRAETLREKIAEKEHAQWAHWTRYMLQHMTEENVERWRRQIDTSYDDLSENEKDADRVWADAILALIDKEQDQ